MSQSAQVSTFKFHTNSVRIVVRDGEPWFVANDVCTALDYVNTSKAVADHLDEDERSTITNSESRNGGGKLTIINESGLYALVLRSRKPQARKFAKWVTGDVLPSIRKTGSYTSTTEPQGYVPEVAFPPDVQAALDNKIWELTTQAQRIVRNYLRIKVYGADSPPAVRNQGASFATLCPCLKCFPPVGRIPQRLVHRRPVERQKARNKYCVQKTITASR